MIQHHSIKQLTTALESERNKGKSIGFVPTMGALHKGHLSLVEKCNQMCDICVVSIFVNPTQFNDPKDLERYPRTVESDKALLQSVTCDYLFVPDVSEIYNDNTPKLHFDFGQLEKVMEGRFRPGHFTGVAQVVTLLFDIVNPHYAFFGEKDFQQLSIIRTMVEQQQKNIQIIPCPIIREEDGLAMSSRNMLLTPQERKAVPTIYKALLSMADNCRKTPLNILKQVAIEQIETTGVMSVEYLEIADEATLRTVEQVHPQSNTRVFIAVTVGKIRLIDNIALQ